MDMHHHLAAVLAVRLHELRRDGEADRGDSPVPTAIIMAGLAVLAALVVTMARDLVLRFMNTAPTP
jgi:hypothetical protein